MFTMIIIFVLSILLLGLLMKNVSAKNIPDVNFDFDKFSNQLGFSESSGNYSTVNSIGALGKYQFMPSTMMQLAKQLNINISKQDFLNNPNLQEKFYKEYVYNILYDIYYNYHLDYYLGTYIKGKKNKISANINIYGLVAGAWLGGTLGLKKLLVDKYDAYDGATYVSDYVAKFSKLNSF